MDVVRTATQFELRDGSRVAAYMEYIPMGSAVLIHHTQTDPACAGQGMATRLAIGVMELLQDSDTELLPTCPFVQRFLTKNSEYIALVPAQRREEFGLIPA